MTQKVIQIGTSLGITLPKKTMKELGLNAGDEVQVEIDAKNKQLASKILFQSNRNELIKDIIAMLMEIPNQSEIPKLQSVIEKLKVQHRKRINWNSFLSYFEQINPDFLSALKERHPNLTANEIRLLSYIYLNFDIKEIAKLFNITPEYCRKKKYRLSQKMNVPTSEMYQYLVSVDTFRKNN